MGWSGSTTLTYNESSRQLRATGRVTFDGTAPEGMHRCGVAIFTFDEGYRTVYEEQWWSLRHRPDFAVTHVVLEGGVYHAGVTCEQPGDWDEFDYVFDPTSVSSPVTISAGLRVVTPNPPTQGRGLTDSQIRELVAREVGKLRSSVRTWLESFCREFETLKDGSGGAVECPGLSAISAFSPSAAVSANPVRAWVEPGAVVYSVPAEAGVVPCQVHGAAGVLVAGECAGVGRIPDLPPGHVVFEAGGESAPLTIPPAATDPRQRR